jgi:HEAT repeat protein
LASPEDRKRASGCRFRIPRGSKKGFRLPISHPHRIEKRLPVGDRAFRGGRKEAVERLRVILENCDSFSKNGAGVFQDGKLAVGSRQVVAKSEKSLSDNDPLVFQDR